jgi:glycosyltransferase involved in cell wall biosynthesis
MASLVIIPAFNEEKNLPHVLAEIRAYLPGFSVVVVNDGSKDRTAAIAASLGATVISHPVNIGYGAAVQTGFKFACKNACNDVIVIMDADGQHDAKDAPALIRALKEHTADMVIGSRFMAKNTYKTTFSRVVGRNLFSLITYLVTHKRFLDITSGFKALNGRATAFLSRNYPVDFPDAEVIILMLLSGFRIVETPACFRQRIGGRSMFSLSKKIYYPFRGLLAVLIVVLQVIFKKEN